MRILAATGPNQEAVSDFDPNRAAETTAETAVNRSSLSPAGCNFGTTRRYIRAAATISRTNTVRPHPIPGDEQFDRVGELAFVRAVLAERESAIVEFEERMRCVPRILQALNGRRGRPLHDHDLADLVQDTVLIVLRKLPEFAAWAPLEGWIYRLCFLEFQNALRRRRREWQRTSEITTEPGDPGVDAGSNHAHDHVHLALTQLGGVEAETIRWKHFDGLTFQEIGVRLDMPPNTVKTRYYRGLAKLEALLRTYSRREESA